MKRLFATLAFTMMSAVLLCTIPSCATVAALLPDVIAAVMDGAQILDAIENFVALYFVQHPDAEAQKKVGEAITKARMALNIALRTAQASDKLNDAQVEAAFVDFKAAYLELLALTKPYGVHPAGNGRLMASPTGQGLEVPEPIAFHSKKGRGR